MLLFSGLDRGCLSYRCLDSGGAYDELLDLVGLDLHGRIGAASPGVHFEPAIKPRETLGLRGEAAPMPSWRLPSDRPCLRRPLSCAAVQDGIFPIPPMRA